MRMETIQKEQDRTEEEEHEEDDDEEQGDKDQEEMEEDTEEGGDSTNEIRFCPFNDCDKQFYSKWSLTRHVRTHTGERPFKCTMCGKEFVQKCSLKRHEQTHRKDKQWICDFAGCQKKFKLKDYLDAHKKAHQKVDARPPNRKQNPVSTSLVRKQKRTGTECSSENDIM